MNKINNFYETGYAYDVRTDHLMNLGNYPGGLSNVLKSIHKEWGHDSRIGTIYVYKDETGAIHIHFKERGRYTEVALPDDIPVMDMGILSKN